MPISALLSASSLIDNSHRRGRVAALVTAVGALLATPALAQEVDVTSTTVVSWHADNDDDPDDTTNYDDEYGEASERLNVTVAYEAYLASLRLDIGTYLSPPTFTGAEPPALADRYDTYINPEKLSVSWRSRDIQVVAGDSYVSFGRGLVLSMRKIDEFGTDSTVRGAKVLVHKGEAAATLIAGYANINNIDDASGRSEDDPYDAIAGVQLSYNIDNAYRVGARAAAVGFRAPLGFVPPGADAEHYKDQWLMFGPSIDIPRLTDELGIYLEGVGQKRNQGTLPEAKDGYGLYGSATYHRGKATIVAEGKAYGNLAIVQPDVEHAEFSTIQYYNPPTLERITQIIDHAQQDTIGGRLRFDWSANKRTLLFANYAYIRDYIGFQVESDDGLEVVDATVHDPYAGVELRWNEMSSRLRLIGGVRVAIADKTGDVVRGDRHVEVEGVQKLSTRLSLVLTGSHANRAELDAPFVDKDWHEGSWQLGLQWSPKLSAGVIYDYTTDETEPKTHYFSGVIEWRPHELALLRVLAGSSHGGLRCISNVCRYFPPFEGAKVTATVRY